MSHLFVSLLFLIVTISTKIIDDLSTDSNIIKNSFLKDKSFSTNHLQKMLRKIEQKKTARHHSMLNVSKTKKIPFTLKSLHKSCTKIDEVIIKSLPTLALLTNDKNVASYEFAIYSIKSVTRNSHFGCFNNALYVFQNIQIFYENSIHDTSKENLIVIGSQTVGNALLGMKSKFMSVNM